jgi:DNA-directed RNA polymerase specialized sigma24 family protein
VPIPSQPIPGSQAAPKTDETAVLQRIAEGDVAALGTLFDQMARPVYSLAMHLVRNHDNAEDVVERTFWHAWENATRLVDEPDVQVWLLSTAKRRLLELSPQNAAELSEIDVTTGEPGIPGHPINPGRAAGIRSRLISRASADTERRAVTVTTTAASRIKPPSGATMTNCFSPRMAA